MIVHCNVPCDSTFIRGRAEVDKKRGALRRKYRQIDIMEWTDEWSLWASSVSSAVVIGVVILIEYWPFTFCS